MRVGRPESLPITLTETTPTGVGLQAVPTPTDPNWNCSATDVGTNTVDCVYTPTSAIAPGTALEPIVVPAFMADTTVGDQITDSSPTASSPDSTEVFASDTVTVAQAPVGLNVGVTTPGRFGPDRHRLRLPRGRDGGLGASRVGPDHGDRSPAVGYRAHGSAVRDGLGLLELGPEPGVHGLLRRLHVHASGRRCRAGDGASRPSSCPPC